MGMFGEKMDLLWAFIGIYYLILVLLICDYRQTNLVPLPNQLKR